MAALRLASTTAAWLARTSTSGVIVKCFPTRARRLPRGGLTQIRASVGTAPRRRVMTAAGRPRGARRVTASAVADADDSDRYKMPPPDVAQFVERPQSPGLSLSPDRSSLLYSFRPPPYPFVSELARPELKLAGLRIDETQNSRSRMSGQTGIALGPIPATEDEINAFQDFKGVPPGATLNYVSWSTDAKSIAFTVRFAGPDVPDEDRAPPELWVADVETKQCRALLPGRGLNTLFESYSWLDPDTIVACVVPEGRGGRPQKPPTPRGPRVQSNTSGNVAQARTYADLLKDAHDADLFEYFCTSEFVKVTVGTGEATPFTSESAIYTRCEPSPDGEYVIISSVERPFSYEVPCGRFPKRTWIVNRAGKTVREVCALPLADKIPIVHNSVREGPRAINWRPDKPAELYWTEAQDGGDPRIDASPRDITYTADMHEDANAAGVPTFQTDLRYGGVSWGADGLGLLYESWYKTRTLRAWVVDTFKRPNRAPRLLFDRNYEDSYDDPGSPMTRRMPNGAYLLAQMTGPLPTDGWKPAEFKEVEGDVRMRPGPVEWETGVTLIFSGEGASDTGDKPFLDLYNVDTGATRRLWQCRGEGALERPGSIISDAGGVEITLDTLKILLSRETPSENPQYYSLELGASGDALTTRRITDFPHPHPALVDPPKQILRYKRADGVDLNATLYTPPGYDAARDGPLPTIMWAYPREFNSAEAAGQLRDSPNRFTSISPMSPLVWLARGYAILDGPSLPIIGAAADGVEPNDTYIEQLVAGARAAVDACVEKGVTDPRRIAVGGHSYGAFMAANLLAHAPDLFACAVARSGAYNRTLTPFGFQAEERTLWQAPETYMAMSPFMFAHKVKKPILLIHGEEDTNSGTNVIQTERFFAALKGNGAEVKMVLLPHESHGTRGFESVCHTLAETSDWLDAHTSVSAVEAAAEKDKKEAELAAKL